MNLPSAARPLLVALLGACAAPPDATALITRDAEGIVAEVAAPLDRPATAWSAGQAATLHAPDGARAATVARLLPDGHGGVILHLRPRDPAGLSAGSRVGVTFPAP